jgi:hypothetical protein
MHASESENVDLSTDVDHQNPLAPWRATSCSFKQFVCRLCTNYASVPCAGAAEYRDLETAAGFPYRSVLGTLIYTYVFARSDIGYALTMLSRFSDHHAITHYDALCCVAA